MGGEFSKCLSIKMKGTSVTLNVFRHWFNVLVVSEIGIFDIENELIN